MSKSIEERIVKMRFDNAGFEKGVAETKKSLDELNEKVQMKNTSKGLEELSASASKVNLSPLTDSVEKVRVKFSALNTIAETVFRNLTTSAMQTGSKIVNALVSPIIEGGKTRALNLANAQFQVEGLFGTDKDENGLTYWDKLLEDINYGVEDTAYGLDVAAKAAAQFGASGVQAGKQMKTALRGISGVAAMTNSDYESIADIFTKISGNGRVMGEELNQLASRGLNAAATLAKYLGVTEQEVRDMVSKGKIDFATFSQAMDDAFGEHAKKANDTFTGSLSNMKAALARIGAEFWTPFLVVARDVFNTVTKVIKPLKNLLSNSIIKSINENVRKVADTTIGWLNGIADGLNKAQKGLDMFIPIWIHQADKYGQAIEGEAELAEQAWDELIAKTGKSKEELLNSEEHYAALVFSSIKNSLESIRETISAVFYAVTNAFKMVSNFIGLKSDALSIVTVIQNVTSSIKNMVSSVSNGLGKIADLLAFTRAIMLKSFHEVSDFMSTGDFSSILGNLFNIVSGIFNKLSRIVEKIMTILGYVLQVIQMIYITASSIISKIFNSIAVKIFEFRANTKSIISTWNDVIYVIQWAIEKISKLLVKVFEIFNRLWDENVEPVLKIIFEIAADIKNVVVDTINDITNGSGNLLSIIGSIASKVASFLTSGIINIIETVGKLLIAIGEVIKNIIIPAFDYLWKSIKPIFGYLKESFKTIVKDSGLYDKAVNAISKVTEFWRDKTEKVKRSLDKLSGSIKTETGLSDKWKNVVNKIVKVLDTLAHKLVDAASKFVDFAKKVKDTVTNSGAFTSVVESIKSIFSSVKDTFTNLGPIVSSLKESFSQIAKSAGSTLISTLSSLASKIGSGLGPAITKVLELFDSFLKAAIKIAGQLKDKLSPAFQDATKYAKNLLSQFKEFTGGKLGSVMDFFKSFSSGSKEVADDSKELGDALDESSEKTELFTKNYLEAAGQLTQTTKNISKEMRNSAKNMSDAVQGVADVKKDSKTINQNINDTIDNLTFGESSGSLFKDMVSAGGGSILTVLKGVFDIVRNLGDFLSKMNPELVSTVILVGASVYGSIKFAKASTELVKSLTNITSAGNNIAAAIKNLSETFKSFGTYLKRLGTAAIIKAFGIALLELVAAFAILVLIAHLTKEDRSSLIWAVSILGAFLGVAIFASIFLADKVDKTDKASGKLKPNRFKKAMGEFSKSLLQIGAALLMVSASVLVLVVAIRLMKGIKWEEIWQGFTALLAVIVILTPIIYVLGKNADKFSNNALSGSKSLIKMSAAIKNLGKALVGYGVAIYVIAKALKQLKGIKYEEIKDGLAAVMVVMSMFILVMEVMKSHENRLNANKGKFTVSGKSSALFQTESEAMALSSALKAFGTAVLLISVSLKLLSSIDANQLKDGVDALTKILYIFTALVSIISFNNLKIGKDFSLSFKDNAKSVSALALTLLSFGGSVLMLSESLKILSRIDPTQLQRATNIIIAILGIVGLFMVTMMLTVKSSTPGRIDHISQFLLAMGISMIAISASMVVLAAALKIISTIDTGSLFAGGFVLGAFLAAISAIMIYVQKNVQKISKNWKGFAVIAAFFVVLAESMLLISGALYIVGQIDFTSQIGGLIALGGLMMVMTGISMLIIKFAEGIVNNDAMTALVAIGLFFLALGGTMLIIAKALQMVGEIENLGKAAGTLYAFIATFAVIATVITLAAGAITTALPAIAIMGGLLLALATSMLEYAAALKVLSTISKEGAENIAYVIETGGKALLSLLPMLGTSIAQFIGNLITELATQAPRIAEAIATLFAQVIIAITAKIPEMLRAFLQNIVDSLSILLEFVPPIVDGIFNFLIKVIEEVTARLPELVGSVVQMLYTFFASVIDAFGDVDMSKLIQGLAAVGLLTAITVGLAAVSLLVPLAMAGLMGLAVMAVMMAEVFSALASIEGLGDKIDKATDIVIKIGNMIGSFIGALVGSMAEQYSSHLPAIGTSFSQFSESIAPFVNAINGMDTSQIFSKVLALAGALVMISGAEMIANLAGSTSLPGIAKSFGAFATDMQPFFDVCGQLSDDAVAGAEALAKIVLAITAASFIDGINLFGSIKDTAKQFSDTLPDLGKSIKEFSDEVKGIDPGAVVAASEAAKNLGEMASALPNSGGLWGFLAGENDMDEFGRQLESFGRSLVRFSIVVSSKGAINKDAIDVAVQAGKSLAELGDSISNVGGVVAWFAGDNDFETFGQHIVSFANALKDVTLISAFGIELDPIAKVVSVGQEFAKLQSSMSSIGGVVGWFSGDADFESFGEGIITFAMSLAGLSSIDLDESKCKAAMDVMSYIGDKMSSLADITISDVLQVMLQYGPAIESLGSSMSIFTKRLSGFEPSVAASAVTSFKDITDLAIYISSHLGEILNSVNGLRVFGDAISNFIDAIDSSDADVLTDLADALNELTPNIFAFASGLNYFVDAAGAFTESYQGIVDSFINGTSAIILSLYSALEQIEEAIPIIGEHATNIIETFCNTLQNVANASIPVISGVIDSVLGAIAIKFGSWIPVLFIRGAQLVNAVLEGANSAQGLTSLAMDKIALNIARGLSNGLTSQDAKSTVKSGVQELISVIPLMVRILLGIRSPSRVMENLAKYIPMGLAKGITQNTEVVDKAAENMANGITNAVEEALENFNDDVEFNPTIRPVIDMSDINRNAGTINGIFGGASTSMTMAARISARYSGRNRDPYYDINKGLDKLHGDLKELDANNYTVNGITYDDGTAVASAVNDLLRAARIGRRA